ncbi:MAG TPA: DUF499 domain-containing protein, partial [Planctomycetota bacterium]|nr:DUF499 domain-containing protein [Planctomycetota bacterium]
MLGLTLRDEFRGKRLKGTAIELTNDNKTGATQVPAQQFLDITYPSADVLKALEAIGPDHGQTVVLIGERGRGKSHLLAVLYHALTSPGPTRAWLDSWAQRLGNRKIAAIALRPGMRVITESLHKQRYKFLWDLLFEQHPKGEFARGKWAGQGSGKTEVPGEHLLLEMFDAQPTALILDEFQTWFDGLTNTKQYPWRTWAFNFTQILSEIAKEHPDKLALVVSVRNGGSDAYQQLHRIGPIAVDFKGPNARQDRQSLLLHRLFENRLNVAAPAIASLVATHASEFLRLLEVPPSEHARVRQDFIECWPFAPHLMALLEDQVLVATNAQETRDLIRILADLFKRRGAETPILTAADFRIDDEASGVGALLDSVANQHHASIRVKAQRNLDAVRETEKKPGESIPHASELMSSLWLRSIAVDNLAGATAPVLQADITKTAPIDANAFHLELARIKESSFNIHEIGGRFLFREEENPHAKVMASARNDKLFEDGSDRAQLAQQVRYVFSGADDLSKAVRVIVLPRDWETAPWSAVEEDERPDRWDERIPLLVLPEDPEKPHEKLGRWLKDHLQKRRNAVRFLLPRAGTGKLYAERELLVLARAVIKAKEWGAANREYQGLAKKYETELRSSIKPRYDRFAILDRWDNVQPAQCR